mmetsp:Transcript_42008/g.46937  ORF Transcript_42008/g.46937 Transcript_42008/m.46937 type:complete len:83 (+) Transcript_42008:172-420(+)
MYLERRHANLLRSVQERDAAIVGKGERVKVQDFTLKFLDMETELDTKEKEFNAKFRQKEVQIQRMEAAMMELKGSVLFIKRV